MVFGLPPRASKGRFAERLEALPPVTRFPRPERKPRRARSGLRQVFGVIAIGLCLGFAAFGIQQYAAFKREANAAAMAAAGDDDVYTGSILYVPSWGNRCRQMLFDNLSGQLADNGYVDCISAAYHSAADEPKRWPAARVRVISSGFRIR
jgi:hypothetical protein